MWIAAPKLEPVNDPMRRRTKIKGRGSVQDARKHPRIDGICKSVDSEQRSKSDRANGDRAAVRRMQSKKSPFSVHFVRTLFSSTGIDGGGFAGFSRRNFEMS